jgi:hypothetical protein
MRPATRPSNRVEGASMTIRAGILSTLLLTLALWLATAVQAGAEEPADEPAALTPPRLSYVEGETSFWRPGTDEWVAATLNMPLAAGDEMVTGHRGNLEVQVGGQAFVRAWGDTRLGLAEAAPDFLRFTATSGYVALDARSLDAGRAIEIGTPHGALTVESAGYYRLDVAPERTLMVARGPGRATITTPDGGTVLLGPGEQVTLDGATVERAAAPALDVWDTWNRSRSDYLVAAASQRYLSPDVYGAVELDQHGTWRTAPTYGSVWVPSGVPAGWAPYTTGRWVMDPYYGWTWVDTAPWGWAPYHYGRWVYLDGYWAWAPGPIVARPVYAPALVAFFGAPGVRVSVGTPFVSWVALGWGEPLVPWWGPPRFVGRPWWGGWGGPRVVHHVHHVHVYRNTRVRHAVVAVRGDGFGRRPVHEARLRDVDVRQLEPVRGRLPVTVERPSLGAGVRPPQTRPTGPVVTRRPPAERRDWRDERRDGRRDARDDRGRDERRDQRWEGPGDRRDARDLRERTVPPVTAAPTPRAVPPPVSPRVEPGGPRTPTPVVPPRQPAVPGPRREPAERSGERGAPERRPGAVEQTPGGVERAPARREPGPPTREPGSPTRERGPATVERGPAERGPDGFTRPGPGAERRRDTVERSPGARPPARVEPNAPGTAQPPAGVEPNPSRSGRPPGAVQRIPGEGGRGFGAPGRQRVLPPVESRGRDVAPALRQPAEPPPAARPAGVQRATSGDRRPTMIERRGTSPSGDQPARRGPGPRGRDADR